MPREPRMFALQRCTPSFVDEAPFVYDNRAVIAAPPELVFDVVSGLAGDEREWFPNFKAMEWRTATPHGVGSVRRYQLTYMTLDEQFTVWERGRRLTFWVSAWSLPMLSQFMEDYRLTPRADGGTDMLWRVCYRPRWWLRPLHPIMRPMFARDFTRATRQLAAYCARLQDSVSAAAAPSRSRRSPGR